MEENEKDAVIENAEEKIDVSSQKKQKTLKFLIKYGIILLGCVIYSLGVSLFLDPNNVAPGGMTGIAIIINSVLNDCFSIGRDITGILIIVINLPLFVLAFIFIGKGFTLSSLFSTVVSSLFIELWNFLFEGYTGDLLVAALAGGAMFGLGLGLIFRMGASTGGSDIIVIMLRKKFRYLKTGIISFIIDFIIMLIAFIYYRDFELACYTLIAIVLFTVIFDFVLYGGNSAKLVYIITPNDKSKDMTDRILKELDIGATYVDGEGAYTGEDKRIIMCAVKNYLYPRLRDIVKDSDPRAFMIVSSAKEIYGEGYKDHFDDEL